MQQLPQLRSTTFPARLAAVAELVPAGSRVADIGTDHGQLPCMLLSSGRATRCIASDLRALSTARAAWRGGRHPALELRRGFGLRALAADDRIDVIAICGLGARSIERILDDGGRLEVIAPRRLVLQPQTEPGRVRRWLDARGWRLVDERAARVAGRYYVALAAERGVPARLPAAAGLRPGDLLEAGPHLVARRDALAREHWRREAGRLRQIVRRAPGGPGKRAAERRLRLALRVVAALTDDRSER